MLSRDRRERASRASNDVSSVLLDMSNGTKLIVEAHCSPAQRRGRRHQKFQHCAMGHLLLDKNKIH
jgi:hypothetical protein